MLNKINLFDIKENTEEEVNIQEKIKLVMFDNKDNRDFIIDTIYKFANNEGRELISILGSINIEAQRFREEHNHSYTNGNTNTCNIVLAYQPLESVNTGYNHKKEILFSITHELSHCLLGKEIFKGNIEWDTLSEKEETKLNNYLLEESAKSWQNFKSGEIRINPLILYHETFADTFSILYAYNNKLINENDIHKLINLRKEKCKKSEVCNYQVFKLEKEIIKIVALLKKDKLKIEELYFFSNMLSKNILLENIKNNLS